MFANTDAVIVLKTIPVFNKSPRSAQQTKSLISETYSQVKRSGHIRTDSHASHPREAPKPLRQFHPDPNLSVQAVGEEPKLLQVQGIQPF